MDAAVAREGDAIDEESLKQTTTPAAEEAQEAVGVGVLGWLGFIIVNLAAWGFITFASFVSWTFGLGVCVLYTVLLVGLAVWLERRGPVYKQFVNLLWVLAGWFLFISGGYIAINALGDDSWSGTRNVNYPLNPVDFDQDLPSLVPAASSPGLQQWASQLYRSSDGPSFISFGGVVFFNGRSPGNSERLHYTDGTTIAQVEPEISFATNFRVVGTTLYFMASNRLYRMPAGDLTGAVGISLEGKGGGFFQDLYVENSTSLLYFKARLDCTATCAGSQAAHTSVLSIFTLDETAGNPTITDLRGDTCVLWAAQVTCPLGGGSNVIPGMYFNHMKAEDLLKYYQKDCKLEADVAGMLSRETLQMTGRDNRPTWGELLKRFFKKVSDEDLPIETGPPPTCMDMRRVARVTSSSCKGYSTLPAASPGIDEVEVKLPHARKPAYRRVSRSIFKQAEWVLCEPPQAAAGLGEALGRVARVAAARADHANLTSYGSDTEDFLRVMLAEGPFHPQDRFASLCVLTKDFGCEVPEDYPLPPCSDAMHLTAVAAVAWKGLTRTVLWGIIFLAAVPMLILSVYALLWKQMPGLVFNIFGGIQAIAIMVYFLINYDSTPEGGTSGPAAVYGDRFMDFMKWFTLIYTSVLWKALVSWSLITPTAAPWLEEVKTWWAAVVGTAFFVNIHVVLQVPFTTEIWPWVVYALLALLQMLMSAVVQRTVPMVMGALGAFVVAWKIGFEVSEALQFGSREVQYLTTFAIIGLEGVGIILAAIAFARNRDKVQDWVRGLLCCGPCQKKTQPED
ncbi:hypothetical protein AK812_SmicGene41288 [Symbiodinium microadriaticum]|uniref:Uncharacterized protein n=1 Tax=Symbiodinium microadriaticum TaxID=2951 RepID=A0A1Q9C6H8_SYMMI|nr:hypothetical protein AK812_SmicGene41288 [Symbiodinium microadriaticum]